IKNIMLKFWGSEVNEFDEIVMPYNKSAEIIKKIDEFEQDILDLRFINAVTIENILTTFSSDIKFVLSKLLINT
ncbi:hypothetical protein ACT453_60090, partial [Bacillus sp. D-CC]